MRSHAYRREHRESGEDSAVVEGPTEDDDREGIVEAEVGEVVAEANEAFPVALGAGEGGGVKELSPQSNGGGGIRA